VQTKAPQSIRIDQTILWPTVTHSPLVWRYTAYALLLGLVFLAHTWSRVDARETSLALDRARVLAEASRAQNERLMLELATMTSLGSLHERALGIQLTSGARLVEID
jgi:hypothetical protein